MAELTDLEAVSWIQENVEYLRKEPPTNKDNTLVVLKNTFNTLSPKAKAAVFLYLLGQIVNE